MQNVDMHPFQFPGLVGFQHRVPGIPNEVKLFWEGKKNDPSTN